MVHLTAKGFTETLHTVTSVPTKDSKELSQIALSALVPSHHEAIGISPSYHPSNVYLTGVISDVLLIYSLTQVFSLLKKH